MDIDDKGPKPPGSDREAVFASLKAPMSDFAEIMAKISTPAKAAWPTSIGSEVTKTLDDIRSTMLGPMATFADPLKGLRLDLEKLGLGQASAFAHIQEQFRNSLALSNFAELQAVLPRFTLPSAALLGLGEARFGPTGVLAGLGPSMPSALSWIEAPSDGRSRVDAMAISAEPTPTRARQFNVDVDVRCIFCDEIMYADGSQQWTTPDHVRISFKVLPLCAKCVAELHPEEMLERLENLARPKLKLILGGAENPMSPSEQHLRLVPLDDDAE